MAKLGSPNGQEMNVAAIAFAFLDAGSDVARVDATVVAEIARALTATCRFGDVRETRSAHRLVLPLTGVARTLVVIREPGASGFSDTEQALATALADHAAIALIHASRLRAAHDETKRANQAMLDGLLRLARLGGPSGMLGVWVGNLDSDIIDTNDTFAAMLGYSRDEMLDPTFSWRGLTPDEFRLGDARARVEMQSSGTAPLREKQLVRKDGSRIWVMVGSTMLDASQAISFALDIDERKTKELDHRMQLAAIVESSADAIVGKTLDGMITSWNDGARELFGYSKVEAIGTSILKIIPPGREHEEEALLAKLRAGEVTRFETVRRHKLGHDIDVAVTSSPIFDSTGRVIGASKVARDITPRRVAEQARSSAVEAAEAANRELESFSYSVAHDLRAPLRGIDAFSRFLVEDHGDKLDGEAREYLAEIRTNASKMGELIDALLSLSRVTRSELRRLPTDLSTLARLSFAQLREEEPARTVEVSIADALVADCDPRLVRSVITHLVGNAWKFTANRADAHIEVGSTPDGAFFVRDNGVGFDMQYAAKLFAPFQRMHAVGDYPGTGIGLATVQRIVHRHGGKISAKASVGAGATFTFTLGATSASSDYLS